MGSEMCIRDRLEEAPRPRARARLRAARRAALRARQRRAVLGRLARRVCGGGPGAGVPAGQHPLGHGALRRVPRRVASGVVPTRRHVQLVRRRRGAARAERAMNHVFVSSVCRGTMTRLARICAGVEKPRTPRPARCKERAMPITHLSDDALQHVIQTVGWPAALKLGRVSRQFLRACQRCPNWVAAERSRLRLSLIHI